MKKADSKPLNSNYSKFLKIYIKISGPQQVHHHHHHRSHRVHHHHVPTVYMPGGHVDVHYLQQGTPHHVQLQQNSSQSHHQQNNQPVKPPSSRGSHSSDTSSAYSGSDTMQVII